MTRPRISGISPFFIVADVAAALAFYREMLGFEVAFQKPPQDPFFAIVSRDGAMIMVKSVGVEPLPNCERQPAARWDAYLSVHDPDALAAEFASRGVTFSVPLQDKQGHRYRFAVARSAGSTPREQAGQVAR